MYIKDLETAEMLPYRSSIRKSSDYDSWDSYHICGRGYYSWLQRFLEKHVGDDINNVFSQLKHSLKERKVSEKDQKELISYFRMVTNLTHLRYHYPYYVDDDGVLCKEPRKKKNRNKTFFYDEPATTYYLKPTCYHLIPTLTQFLGKDKTSRILEYGMSSKEYYKAPDGYKFDTICQRLGLKLPNRYARSYWWEMWEKKVKYPYIETLEYGTPEYKRYHYESVDAYRKKRRERKKEKDEKFNECEMRVVERKPFLL